jgi:hypothetical protein
MPLSRWRTTPTTSRLLSMEVQLQAAWGKTGKASSGSCPRLPQHQNRRVYQSDVPRLISSTLTCISSRSNRTDSALPVVLSPSTGASRLWFLFRVLRCQPRRLEACSLLPIPATTASTTSRGPASFP